MKKRIVLLHNHRHRSVFLQTFAETFHQLTFFIKSDTMHTLGSILSQSSEGSLCLSDIFSQRAIRFWWIRRQRNGYNTHQQHSSHHKQKQGFYVLGYSHSRLFCYKILGGFHGIVTGHTQQRQLPRLRRCRCGHQLVEALGVVLQHLSSKRIIVEVQLHQVIISIIGKERVFACCGMSLRTRNQHACA